MLTIKEPARYSENMKSTNSISDLLENHAPTSWKKEVSEEHLKNILRNGNPMQMIVLNADIRLSTFLMKEAIDPLRYTHTINDLIEASSTSLKSRRGWFDKFTGDGFLAYWLINGRREYEYTDEILNFSRGLLTIFQQRIVPDLMSNSHNFPAGIGLSMGLDCGLGYIVRIANELTIVGPPVVGAVRMASTAASYEVVINGYLGYSLSRINHELVTRPGFTIRPEIRNTKEYPQGQHVNVLSILEETI